MIERIMIAATETTMLYLVSDRTTDKKGSKRFEKRGHIPTPCIES